MARIETKSKPKLASVIWTWVVVGILTAVVVTGLVLLIIYLVDLANGNDGEVEFEERFQSELVQHITYEELDALLANEPSDIDTSHGIFVFVYSPDFETYNDADVTVEGKTMKLTEFIDSIIEKDLDNFYILNVESEENKDYTIQNSTVSGLSNYPTLLVMDNNANTSGHFGITVPEALEGEIESGIVTNTKQIINVLLSI